MCKLNSTKNFTNQGLVILKKKRTIPKGTVFFYSLEKIKGYSLTRFGHFLFFFISGFVFFFFPAVFFFFPGKVCTPLTQLRKIYLQKKVKKRQKVVFFVDFQFFCCFFFPAKNCFFFPRKSLPVTHSLDFRGRKKKKTASEKKNSIFTHSLEKPQKVANFNLFREEKNTIPLL